MSAETLTTFDRDASASCGVISSVKLAVLPCITAVVDVVVLVVVTPGMRGG